MKPPRAASLLVERSTSRQQSPHTVDEATRRIAPSRPPPVEEPKSPGAVRGSPVRVVGNGDRDVMRCIRSIVETLAATDATPLSHVTFAVLDSSGIADNVREGVSRHPSRRVIAVLPYEDRALVASAQSAGASACFVTTDPPERLVEVVRRLAARAIALRGR